MLKNDLITKMIEKFEKAKSEIDALITKEKFEEAIDLIDYTLSDLFRLNLKSFNSLSDGNLVEIIRVQDLVDADRFIIISALLESEAYIFEKQHRENDSYFIHTKALNLRLVAFIINDEPELISYYKGIPYLIVKVDDFVFSDFTLVNLVQYYARIGDYAEAENLLYDLLELMPGDKNAINFALNFYEYLLKNTDEKLEAGGLPRNEIEAAMAELK